MEAQQKAVEALIEKPSTYKIDVLDDSMLPQKKKKPRFSWFKKKQGIKKVTFTVNPPTMEVLAKCVVPIMEIPEKIREANEVRIEEAVKYSEQMARCFAIMAHGCKTEVPDWHVPFILKNITPRDLYQLFYECSLKLQSDFFLNSLKIANQNPMMMKRE